METRDLDLIAEHCVVAHRLASAQGDKLLTYFLSMALVAAKDARKQRQGAGRGARKSAGKSTRASAGKRPRASRPRRGR